MDDSRTHNAANELTGRDTDTSGVDNYALTYDAVGNLTNDGQTYKFEYDAFGRLRKIRDQSNNLVEEFRYNGLNHRIAWLHDADADNDVDGSDPWFSFVYDRSWRMVASYRGSDSEAKELFVNHQAGLNGSGLALPLDAFILRDRNTSAYWAASVSSFSGERTYHCQNYLGGRGDVVAILTSTGKQMEQVRYSAYGVPFGIPAGDTNADGGVVATPDIAQITAWTSGAYNVRGDFDLDGDVDNDDVNIVSSNFGKSVGWGKLTVGPNDTLTGFVGGFRKGYCGYEHDGTNPKIMHVRHRAYLSDLGRWTRRDPLGYVDGGNLYWYVTARSFTSIDSMGLARRLPIGVDGGVPICPPGTNWNGTFCMPGLCFASSIAIGHPYDIPGTETQCFSDVPIPGNSQLPFDAACVERCRAGDILGYVRCTPNVFETPPLQWAPRCCVCRSQFGSEREVEGAGNILEACASVHEGTHQNQCNSQLPWGNSACLECFAYKAQMECLRQKIRDGACGANTGCTRALEAEHDVMTDRMVRYCSQCNGVDCLPWIQPIFPGEH